MFKTISQAIGATLARVTLYAAILTAAMVLVHAVAQAPAPSISTKPYVVTNSRAFPNLPLPSRSLVFRNGLFQTEGIDYDALPGSSFRFRPGVLDDLDRVAVVTLP